MTTWQKKEYLRGYLRAYKKAQHIGADIARLRMRYAYPSAVQYSDMPAGAGGPRDLSEYMVKVEELERDLNRQLDECIRLEVQIRRDIDMLEDEREREILRLRYIDGMTWEQVASSIPCDVRTATRAHGRALEAFCPSLPMPVHDRM